MLNVDNRKAISLITRRFMKINRGRNLAALLSILLTTPAVHQSVHRGLIHGALPPGC